MSDGWTEDRIKLLRKLWADGLSASQVAAEIGGGVSRNAVIGKLHRLGIQGRDKGEGKNPTKAAAKAVPAPSSPAEVARPARPARPTSIAPIEAIFPRETDEEPIAAPAEGVTLMELGVWSCRFPLGDPRHDAFRFCGARTTAAGRPYCCNHAAIAYQPSGDKRAWDKRLGIPRAA